MQRTLGRLWVWVKTVVSVWIRYLFPLKKKKEPPICKENGNLDDLSALEKAKVVKLCQLAHEYVNDHLDLEPGSYFFIGLAEYGQNYRGELDKEHVVWVHYKCHRYKCEL